jgi:hypothetical protein
MQKLGYKESCELVEKIASGVIYKGELSIRISREDKVYRLKEQFDNIMKNDFSPPDEKSISNDKKSCIIFSINEIIYDNPILNDKDLFKKLSDKFGFSKVIDRSDYLIRNGFYELLEERIGNGYDSLEKLFLGNLDLDFSENI